MLWLLAAHFIIISLTRACFNFLKSSHLRCSEKLDYLDTQHVIVTYPELSTKPNCSPSFQLHCSRCIDICPRQPFGHSLSTDCHHRQSSNDCSSDREFHPGQLKRHPVVGSKVKLNYRWWNINNNWHWSNVFEFPTFFHFTVGSGLPLGGSQCIKAVSPAATRVSFGCARKSSRITVEWENEVYFEIYQYFFIQKSEKHRKLIESRRKSLIACK